MQKGDLKSGVTDALLQCCASKKYPKRHLRNMQKYLAIIRNSLTSILLFQGFSKRTSALEL